MLNLYLACLVFGGIFIAVSLVFGGDADAEADIEVDADVDVDMEIDVDTDIDADTDMDAHGGDFDTGGGTVEAVKFLSFRNVIFFLAFFGLTGTLLTWLGTNFLLTLVSALAFGSVAGTLMHRVMTHLAASEVGEALNLEQLIGMPARVTINVTKDRRGKIVLEASGQRIQLIAQTAEEADKHEFTSGEAVYILRMSEGIAQIVEESFIASPLT